MELINRLKSFLSLLTVIALVMCISKIGLSQNETHKLSGNLPKSFAVFVANYNSNDNEVVGGVAGTAFFISPTKAITAFHVLQSASYNKRPGFEKIKIWLVHEGRPAIEVHLANLREQKNLDLTIIDFGRQKVALAEEIYPVAIKQDQYFVDANQIVESNGFIANSVGPELTRIGIELVITNVARLERIHARGHLLQAANVHLKATDVNLVNASCLQVSYIPIVGLSGGPLLQGGKVIAMNSFADPSHKSTWSIQLANLSL